MPNLSYNFRGSLRQCRILFDSENSFLAHYSKSDFPFECYFSVCRTSRQWYRLTILEHFCGVKFSYVYGFKNIELTALYIEKILRR